MLRVQEIESMATKLAVKRPVLIKPAPKCTPTFAFCVTLKTLKTRRTVRAIYTSDVLKIRRALKSRIPTAGTLEALAELKAGKLNSYADEGELFKKLGIKVGKA